MELMEQLHSYAMKKAEGEASNIYGFECHLTIHQMFDTVEVQIENFPCYEFVYAMDAWGDYQFRWIKQPPDEELIVMAMFLAETT